MDRRYKDKQLQLYTLGTRPDKRIGVYHGAVGTGKSEASLVGFMNHTLAVGHGSEWLFVAPTGQQMRGTIHKMLRERFGISMTPNKKILDWMGMRYYFETAREETDEEKLRGLNVCGAYVDEAAVIPKNYIDQIQARVREGEPEERKIIFTTNPGGSHHWMKLEYIDGNLPMIEEISFNLDDDCVKEQEYIDRTKAMYKGMFYERNILGKWVDAAGAIYNGFSSRIVDGADYEVEDFEAIGIGIDYGQSHLTVAVLIGLLPDGQRVVFDEYVYNPKEEYKSPREIALEIVEQPVWDRAEVVHYDPNAIDMGAALREVGYNAVKANNDVLKGIQHVAHQLDNGLLVVSGDCRTLIRQMSNYSWNDNSSKRGKDEPVKLDDDGPDALRYHVLSTASSGARIIRAKDYYG